MTEQNNNQVNIQDEQNKLINDFKSEPEYEQLTMFCEPIYINTENVEELELDKDEFNKGLKESSYIAGFVTGLINSGWDLDSSINYLFAKLNSSMNIDISNINAKANIETSKNQNIVIEKQQI
jgi:hypothetical protein